MKQHWTGQEWYWTASCTGLKPANPYRSIVGQSVAAKPNFIGDYELPRTTQTICPCIRAAPKQPSRCADHIIREIRWQRVFHHQEHRSRGFHAPPCAGRRLSTCLNSHCQRSTRLSRHSVSLVTVPLHRSVNGRFRSTELASNKARTHDRQYSVSTPCARLYPFQYRHVSSRQSTTLALVPISPIVTSALVPR